MHPTNADAFNLANIDNSSIVAMKSASRSKHDGEPEPIRARKFYGDLHNVVIPAVAGLSGNCIRDQQRTNHAISGLRLFLV